MLTAILALSILAALFGLLLGYADLKFKVESDPVVDQVDALLPQTQCGQCGFPGCRPYAEAIANDDAPINLCPPGGEPGMIALADLLGRAPEALDEDAANRGPSVARIDETLCVGCTACIRACPVDAIVGAAKQMHTVIAHYCTGCRLCTDPCPVDCISVDPITPGIADWKWPMPIQHIAAA